MTTLIRQYRDAGVYREECDRIEKMRKECGGRGIDGVLVLYCLNGVSQGQGRDCEGFLREDMVNLVRVYQILNRNCRLSRRKLIKYDE